MAASLVGETLHTEVPRPGIPFAHSTRIPGTSLVDKTFQVTRGLKQYYEWAGKGVKRGWMLWILPLRAE